jgi:hypothetical protein
MRRIILLFLLVLVGACTESDPIPSGASACWNVKYRDVNRSDAAELVSALSRKHNLISAPPSSGEQRYYSGTRLALIVVEHADAEGDIFAFYGNGRFNDELSEYLEGANPSDLKVSVCPKK